VPQAGGGIAVSGLLKNLAKFNATYAPTGNQIQGYPSFSAGPTRHLFRHPGDDEWQLGTKPFDPAVTACVAYIPAAGGPVPTGARVWSVAVWSVAGHGFDEREVTAREVA
jgi:hypothetical protein